MRTNHSLAAYIIRVRNIDEHKDEQLDAIDGEEDLFTILTEDFQKMSNPHYS
jgi:hypothetical protein